MNKRLLNFLGGDPQRIDDDEFFQNAVIEAIKGLASVWQSGTLDPIIISGLVGTVGATHTVYTPGYIVVNSEIYYVNGGSFVNGTPLGINIDPTFDTNGDKVFENLSNHSTYEVRQGILKNYSGTDMDIADFISIKNRLNTMGAVINLETAWLEVGAPGNIPFASGWSKNTIGSEFINNKVRYRINKIGELQLGGSARNLSTGISGSSLLFTLPSPPSTIKIYPVVANDASLGIINGAFVAIYTNGEVYLKTSAGTSYNVNVSLDLPPIPLT